MAITRLSELETLNAFALRLFRKEISRFEAEAASRDLEDDLESGVFSLRSMPESAFDRARELSWQLTPKIGIRTADLLHVAAALELKASCFFSLDLRQRTAAEAAGLKLNPLP